MLAELESVQIALIFRHRRALFASELSHVGAVKNILVHFAGAVAKRGLVLDWVVKVLLGLHGARLCR